MLTVDYDRLGVRAGRRPPPRGAGAGRHANEAHRRGAGVVALDRDRSELTRVAALFAAMVDADEARADVLAATVNGDGTRLPFPDASFDRVICSEVLEHIADDSAALAELWRVLRPGGAMAATVPAWLPEKVCWALSEEYHAPFVAGGHVRIFTEGELRRKLRAAGFEPGASHHAHALHSPYWWLKCAVGPTNDDHRLVRAYHRLLVWDIARAPKVTRWTERVLNPILGKSLVVYAEKRVQAAEATPARPAEDERQNRETIHAGA